MKKMIHTYLYIHIYVYICVYTLRQESDNRWLTIHHAILYIIPCVVMAGAVDIFNITGAVDIADSAFSDNQAAFGGGRIISLDNDNDNDNDNDVYT